MNTQTPTIPTQLEPFVTSLIDKRFGPKVETLDPETREKVTQDILNQLGVSILESTALSFSEEQRAEFKKMVDDKKPIAELQKYAMEQIPDYNDLVSETLIAFEDAYLSGAAVQDGAHDSFVNALVEERNFSDLTPEIREELRRDVVERLDKFLLDRTLEALSDDDAELFVSMIEKKRSVQDIQQFAKEHIEEYAAFNAEVFRDFRMIYLEP